MILDDLHLYTNLHIYFEHDVPELSRCIHVYVRMRGCVCVGMYLCVPVCVYA